MWKVLFLFNIGHSFNFYFFSIFSTHSHRFHKDILTHVKIVLDIWLYVWWHMSALLSIFKNDCMLLMQCSPFHWKILIVCLATCKLCNGHENFISSNVPLTLLRQGLTLPPCLWLLKTSRFALSTTMVLPSDNMYLLSHWYYQFLPNHFPGFLISGIIQQTAFWVWHLPPGGFHLAFFQSMRQDLLLSYSPTAWFVHSFSRCGSLDCLLQRVREHQ